LSREIVDQPAPGKRSSAVAGRVRQDRALVQEFGAADLVATLAGQKLRQRRQSIQGGRGAA
jgi:hypothetical protein